MEGITNHIQFKDWCLINGEKHFVWSFYKNGDKFMAKCNDGKVREVNDFQNI